MTNHKPEHILLFFVDGLGIGEKNRDTNPCAQNPDTLLYHFLDDDFPHEIEHGYVHQLDANLDVEGLPQSATGQTALLTGHNASKILGRHLNAMPNARLREIIKEYNILKILTDQQKKAAFLNCFRSPFFDINPFDIINHLSVTTCSNLFAGLPFFDVPDLYDEKTVYQDMTGDALRDKGFDAPIFTPKKAGEIVGKQSQNYHFSLFEYFQSDKAGHSQKMERGVYEIEKIDQFLKAAIQNVDLDKTLVIMTSDHGNIEDLSWRGHTRNPAMTLAFGAGSQYFIQNTKSIMDVTPALLELIK